MRILLSLPVLLVITSCVSAPPPPSPVRRVTPPSVAALPPPAPAPLASDWRDWPQTPGNWRYQATDAGSGAMFGDAGRALFALQCDRSRRQIYLIDFVPRGGSFTIRTSTLARVTAFYIDGDPPGGSVITKLPVTDPLLDAIAFSRGRFVIEQPGQPPLVLPAWAEIDQVIEDCRS